MKTVYLAGPINAATDDEAKGWREKVTEALDGHYRVLDPMRRDYRGKEVANGLQIVVGDLEDIRQSDFVLAFCERPAWGTAMEIYAAARVFMRTVICIAGSNSPWLTVHASLRVPTVEDAVSWFLRVANEQDR